MLLSGGDGNCRRDEIERDTRLRLVACRGREESSNVGEPVKRQARSEMGQGGRDKNLSRQRESVKGRSL